MKISDKNARAGMVSLRPTSRKYHNEQLQCRGYCNLRLAENVNTTVLFLPPYLMAPFRTKFSRMTTRISKHVSIP